jgi:hypothetical protein
VSAATPDGETALPGGASGQTLGGTEMFGNWLPRKKFLIQPKFQLALGAAMMVLVCAYSAILVFSIMYPMSTFLDLSPEGSINPEIKSRILTIPGYVWLIVLIFGLLLAFQAILISHRIAGPTFRLRRAIREITDGKYQQNLTLRRYDCLKDLATGLAQLGLLLHSRRENLLAEVAGLRTALDAHRQRLARGGEVASLQADIDPMLRRVQSLEQIVQGLPDGQEEPAISSAPVTTVPSQSLGPAA